MVAVGREHVLLQPADALVERLLGEEVIGARQTQILHLPAYVTLIENGGVACNLPGLMCILMPSTKDCLKLILGVECS